MRHLNPLRGAAAVTTLLLVLSACGQSTSTTEDEDASSGAATTSTAPNTPPSPAAIPADFPLAQGLASDDGDFRLDPPSPDGEGLAQISVCGEEVWPPGGDSGDHQRLVTQLSGPEFLHSRELYVLADEAAAQQVMEAVLAASTACTRFEDQRWEVVDSTADVVTLAQGWRGPGLVVQRFTRVGAAVLLVSEYTESMLTMLPEAAEPVIEPAERLAGEMCVFSAEGCPDGGPTTGTATSTPSPSATTVPSGMPCDPGLGGPVVTSDCPEPLTGTYVEGGKGGSPLLVQPVEVRWSDDPGAEAWAAEHGVEYPFPGGYHQEPQGEVVRVLPGAGTTCTWWMEPGGTTGDTVVPCAKLVRLLTRGGGTLAVWSDGDDVRQVSALYRP